MENLDKKVLKQHAINPYSINNLKLPLSTTFYNLRDSYINPYVTKVCVKKKKMEYPPDDEVYDNDINDESIVGSGVLNLRYYTQLDG